MNIEKKRVIPIELTPEDVRKAIENYVRAEDESIVFPAAYPVDVGLPAEVVATNSDRYPSIKINLEIPEPRKPGRPKGSKRKVDVGTGGKGTPTDGEPVTGET
ncbi:MAG: hypothetical protein PHQ43_00020 [Dehalococcoidales bacterium]|nr:hypothetical protein [Dehalococcoidales bacterium]